MYAVSYLPIGRSIVLLLTLIAMLVQASSVRSAEQLPPLTAEQIGYFGRTREVMVYTGATLQRSGKHIGQLNGQTIDRAVRPLASYGYNVAVYVVLRDASNATIGVSDVHTFNTLALNQRERILRWHDQFEPCIAAATTQLDIIQRLVPGWQLKKVRDETDELKSQIKKAQRRIISVCVR